MKDWRALGASGAREDLLVSVALEGAEQTASRPFSVRQKLDRPPTQRCRLLVDEARLVVYRDGRLIDAA